jgi:hypothetical protein
MVEIKVAQIRYTRMVVTDHDSFCQALTSVSSDEGTKFPPIAGVMHLAPVLRDAAFSNMAYDDLKAVIDVKARGTLNLHDVFKDESLDFFIMTSSI